MSPTLRQSGVSRTKQRKHQQKESKYNAETSGAETCRILVGTSTALHKIHCFTVEHTLLRLPQVSVRLGTATLPTLIQDPLLRRRLQLFVPLGYKVKVNASNFAAYDAVHIGCGLRCEFECSCPVSKRLPRCDSHLLGVSARVRLRSHLVLSDPPLRVVCS